MHREWNPRQTGWHERVHLRLGENLYYFFFKLSPFDTRRARHELDEMIKKNQLGSVRSFEIFGAYDLIVRAWLHPNIVNQFRGWLTSALKDQLRATHTFEVTHIDRRWYKSADPKVLAKIDDRIIQLPNPDLRVPAVEIRRHECGIELDRLIEIMYRSLIVAGFEFRLRQDEFGLRIGVRTRR